MVTGQVTKQVKSKVGVLTAALRGLAQKEVYVGIPAENATRKEAGDINNAELLYIHTHGVRKKEMRDAMEKDMAKGMKYSKAHALYLREHGSPMLSVPPRPVLQPAIEANKDVIGKQISLASKAALQGKPAECEENLHKAGMVAASAAKGWFENPENGWPPNSPKTIKRKGSDQPLIDTGEMRKAITYVVRNRT